MDVDRAALLVGHGERRAVRLVEAHAHDVAARGVGLEHAVRRLERGEQLQLSSWVGQVFRIRRAAFCCR